FTTSPSERCSDCISPTPRTDSRRSHVRQRNLLSRFREFLAGDSTRNRSFWQISLGSKFLRCRWSTCTTPKDPRYVHTVMAQRCCWNCCSYAGTSQEGRITLCLDASRQLVLLPLKQSRRPELPSSHD